MKRLISISLFFIMLGFSFIQIGIFFEYVIDVEAYTEKYCINKDAPEKKCNGKCHLTDELAKSQEQHQQNELQNLPEILLFHAEKQIEVPAIYSFDLEEESNFIYQPLFIEGVYYSVFAPPKI